MVLTAAALDSLVCQDSLYTVVSFAVLEQSDAFNSHVGTGHTNTHGYASCSLEQGLVSLASQDPVLE